MSIKDTDRKARANYRAKTEKVQLDLYPGDSDIKARLDSIDEPKASYIKRLIREDIAANEPVPGVTYYDERRDETFTSLGDWKRECLNFARDVAGWTKNEAKSLAFIEENGYIVMRDQRTQVEYERAEIRGQKG